jgi:hypothetical protein
MHVYNKIEGHKMFSIKIESIVHSDETL